MEYAKHVDLNKGVCSYDEELSITDTPWNHFEMNVYSNCFGDDSDCFKQVSGFFFLVDEVVECILSFAGPIPYVRLCNISKQGSILQSHIPQTLKKTWMSVCQDVHPDYMSNDAWWIFACGLILKLQSTNNDSWEADEFNLIHSLLCGLWDWWHISMEEMLLKVLRDVIPPKVLLGRIFLKIYCDIYTYGNAKDKTMIQYLIKANPEISTLHALKVSGADVHSHCNGLYIAREKEEYSEFLIYDLWAYSWTPSRCLIFSNKDKSGINTCIIGNGMRNFPRTTRYYELRNDCCWFRLHSSPFQFESSMTHGPVEIQSLLCDLEDFLSCGFSFG